MEIYCHSVFVHFAVTLFPLSVFFDIIALTFKRPKHLFAAWITLILSGMALLAAVATGLLAKANLRFAPPAKATLEIHQTLALINVVLVFILLFWRIRSRENLPGQGKWPYILISVIAVILILLGGFYGGKLVHHHGIGISDQNTTDHHSAPIIEDIPSFPADDNLFQATDSIRYKSSD